MWYRINGNLINMERVVNIYIAGEKSLVFVLNTPIAGASGRDTHFTEFKNVETKINFKDTAKRNECFSKLTEALNAVTL